MACINGYSVNYGDTKEIREQVLPEDWKSCVAHKTLTNDPAASVIEEILVLLHTEMQGNRMSYLLVYQMVKRSEPFLSCSITFTR